MFAWNVHIPSIRIATLRSVGRLTELLRRPCCYPVPPSSPEATAPSSEFLAWKTKAASPTTLEITQSPRLTSVASKNVHVSEELSIAAISAAKARPIKETFHRVALSLANTTRARQESHVGGEHGFPASINAIRPETSVVAFHLSHPSILVLPLAATTRRQQRARIQVVGSDRKNPIVAATAAAYEGAYLYRHRRRAAVKQPKAVSPVHE
ncbi:hypothetical protein Ae201684P_013296 [Aphanomyces euteiches]|uniref:Uncharacterized protein n=1 Tax=Aphanomyces euteiches TaxID=100861 RepID=A0A6G0WS54_9STRA|nr:hypothetical protein Ae201684_012258 [Aphanomyces euteiches]KAH9096630.1 hypothetical protein Ae201684P_013296 [Aphanomyces euteiches]